MVTKPWKPDAELRDQVGRKAASRRDDLQLLISREWDAENERAAARARRSERRGEFPTFDVYPHMRDFVADRLAVFGLGLADDLMGTVQLANNGVIPDGAGEWIQKQFARYFPTPTSLAVQWFRGVNKSEERLVRAALVAATEKSNRALEIRLGDLSLRSRVRKQAAAGVKPIRRLVESSFQYDAMISHAGEDIKFAEDLAKALTARHYHVWLDKYEFTVGDPVLGKIDEGLRSSRFGIALIGPHFFDKPWALQELAALFSRQEGEVQKVLLPVWHEMTHADVAAKSPMLAGLHGIDTNQGLEVVVEELTKVLRRKR